MKQNLSSTESAAVSQPRRQQSRERLPPPVRLAEVQRQQRDSSTTPSFFCRELEELPQLLLLRHENVPSKVHVWPGTVRARKRMVDLWREPAKSVFLTNEPVSY